MREFITLLENAATVTLYRGDASEIKRFEVAKTDEDALFGMGIYLTDHPEIAKDYTVKGSDGIEFRVKSEDRPETPNDLIRAYLRTIMTDIGYDSAAEALKKEWQQKFWAAGWTPEERVARQEQFQQQYAAARSKLVRTSMDKAKRIFKERRPNMKISKLTTGEYVFVHANRKAIVSKFEVPVAYLSKCLHGERPVSNKVLKIIRAAYIRSGGGDENRKFDLRIADPKASLNSNANTFDDFIVGYRKHGSRYAWLDTNHGGDGTNPSLDFLWNGTHSGYHVFKTRESQQALINDLVAAGYVGLAYDGGVRGAGTGSRGGGGFEHHAYVLWDEDAVASFRAGTETVTDDDVGDLEKGIRSKSVLAVAQQ